eukprot:scaffold201746_cov20-Tisochrysis_lutea.AAC.1
MQRLRQARWQRDAKFQALQQVCMCSCACAVIFASLCASGRSVGSGMPSCKFCTGACTCACEVFCSCTAEAGAQATGCQDVSSAAGVCAAVLALSVFCSCVLQAGALAGGCQDVSSAAAACAAVHVQSVLFVHASGRCVGSRLPDCQAFQQLRVQLCVCSTVALAARCQVVSSAAGACSAPGRCAWSKGCQVVSSAASAWRCAYFWSVLLCLQVPQADVLGAKGAKLKALQQVRAVPQADVIGAKGAKFQTLMQMHMWATSVSYTEVKLAFCMCVRACAHARALHVAYRHALRLICTH